MTRAQSSLEFLYSAFFALLFFMLMVVLFSASSEDGLNLSAALRARTACKALAAQVDRVYAAGNGTSAQLEFPDDAVMGHYVFFFTGNRSIHVKYGDSGVSCRYANGQAHSLSGAPAFNVTYSPANLTLHNTGEGVVIG
jgi:hypothetical protein